MKKSVSILSLTLSLFLVGGISCAEEKTLALDKTVIERLAGLCKLWGNVKYFHPFLAYKDIDWDTALVEAIPNVRAARTPAEYKGAIDSFIAVLGDPDTHTMNKPLKTESVKEERKTARLS